MSRSKVPDWAVAEILAWIDGAKSGDLILEFNCGTPQRLRRGEVVTPPRETAAAPTRQDPGVPKLPPQYCPDDGAVMAERDYGEKFTCSQCNKTWAVWDLRKRGKLASWA